MYRQTLAIGLILTGLATVPVAHAQRAQSNQSRFEAPYTSYTGKDAFATGAQSSLRYSPPPNAKQVAQMVRWNAVGQCVSAQDREASLTWINAHRGSAQAAVANDRLEPLFARCLAGAGVTDPRDKALRRAALADALRVDLRQ